MVQHHKRKSMSEGQRCAIIEMHVTQDCLEPGILITIPKEKILQRSYAKGSHISHTVYPIIFGFLRSLSHWEKYTKLTYFNKKKVGYLVKICLLIEFL